MGTSSAYRRCRAISFALLCLLFLGLNRAHATVITNGCANVNVSCSLTELFNGASIQVGEKLFDQWELIFFDADGLVDFSQITVSGLDDGGLVPGHGLRYNGNGQLVVNAMGGTNFIDLQFGYDITAFNHHSIFGNSLEITAFALGDPFGGDAIVDIREDVSDKDKVFITDKLVGIDELFFDPSTLRDSVEFEPHKQLWIENDIFLDAGFGGLAVLDHFEQRFAQVVSEPGTLALFSLSLAGIGLMRHRRKYV